MRDQTSTTPGRSLRWIDLLLLLCFGTLLCLPLLTGWLHGKPGRPTAENRSLATMPSPPHDWPSLVAYPTGLSAFIGDHYGLRSVLVNLDGQLRYHLFGEFVSDQVWLGRHGRLFFISHTAAAPFSLTDRICGEGVGPNQVTAAASGLLTLLRQGIEVTPATYYVSVPTSPVIDGKDLPRWLARRCSRGSGIFVPRLQAALAVQDKALSAHLVYPRQVLEAAKADGMPYPIWNFHWSGAGARPVAEDIGGRLLGLPRLARVPVHLEREQSDLAQFTPGVTHRDMVPVPDHAGAGVSFCYGGGGACNPGLAPFADAINEITQSRSGAGPSVLVISDSFGRMPAQYLSEYFGRMLHLNIAFERLKPGELTLLARQIAVEIGRPDVLLFIYHDAAAIDAGGLAGPFATIAAAFR